jgi:hypothetical protein
MFLKFDLYAFMKVTLTEAIYRGSSLIFSTTVFSVINDNGATLAIGSFLIFCWIIFPDSLSNLKESMMATFWAFNDVYVSLKLTR